MSPKAAANSVVLARALEWLDAGASVLPFKADGSKSPDVPTWKPLMEQAEDPEEVEAYYKSSKGHTGLGIVFGYGDLECLDFDAADIWDAYQKAAADVGLGDLLARVVAGYCERTPNGVHLIWRCSEVSGNKKLASDPERGQKSGLIETRGRGGVAIVAPSYGKVHETGQPYVLESGGPASVAEITSEERSDLLALARTFDRRPPKAPREKPTRLADGTRPGDDFNRHGPSWAELLEEHDWAEVYTRDDVTHWRRPGKSVSISATTNHAGSDLLWVFSTNAEPFEAERSYDKFGAYAALNHDGDLAAAATELAEEGYGKDDVTERFALVSAADLAMPVPPMRWLVRQIWPEKSHGPLAGAKKSLKSWNALALAVAVASGQPYLGKFDVEQTGPVLIFNGEGGQVPFARRYQRIAETYGVAPAELPIWATFDVGPLDGHAFRDRLKAHLDAVQPVLVILDPLYTYHPQGIEAQNLYDRGRMLGDLSKSVGHDTALIVVDHYRKNGATNLDLDEIGQSGVAQWADSWVLQAHREDPDLETGSFRLAAEYGSRQWGGKRWSIDWECGAFDYELCEPEGDITWLVESFDGTSSRSGRSKKPFDNEVNAAVMDFLERESWRWTKEKAQSQIYGELKERGGTRVQIREAWDRLDTQRLITSEMRPVREGSTTKKREVWAANSAPVIKIRGGVDKNSADNPAEVAGEID